MTSTISTPCSNIFCRSVSLLLQITIPGAKRIRVVFDERCSTEMGCDFVRIYKGQSRGGSFVRRCLKSASSALNLEMMVVCADAYP